MNYWSFYIGYRDEVEQTHEENPHKPGSGRLFSSRRWFRDWLADDMEA
jgi:hypothetical protein